MKQIYVVIIIDTSNNEVEILTAFNTPEAAEKYKDEYLESGTLSETQEIEVQLTYLH